MVIAKYYAGFLCLCLFFVKAFSEVGVNCSSGVTQNSTCSTSTEVCDTTTNKCQCLQEFVIENNVCVHPQTTPNYSSLVDNQGNGSLVAGILIPLFLIAIVICSIYVGKRFEVVKWLRSKLNQRNRNYDEFMIGQDDDDDPPLV